MPSLRFIALAFVLLAAACGERNPNFCEGAACNEVDASPDAPPITCDGNGPDTSCPAANPVCESGECTGSCTADTDCAGRPASERVCHMMSGACVECDENNTQATPGQAEDECPAANNAVCDGDTHTCRPCEAHSECFAGVCDAGVCVPQANIIFLTPAAEGGTDGAGNDCLSATTGCLTLHYAIGKLTATRKYILFKPSATPYPVRNNTDRADFNGDTAHIIGYGASVRRNGADGEVIEVHAAGVNVTIEGLDISNATGPGSGSGIKFADGALTLYRVKLTNNAYRGVHAASGTLVVRRSQISNNDGGGIFFDGPTIVLINNFIVGNGDMNGSTLGGVFLNSTGTGSIVEFNTIAANAASTGTAHGAICNSPGGPLTARNNIVSSEVNRPQTSGGCLHEYTLFGGPGTAPTGTGNMNIADPAMFMFVNATDYHILAGSVAAGKAQSTPLIGDSLFDIDGDPRVPGSTTLDVGADEIP